MIARIKGLKISQASERTAVTGQEMIPFQDGERNGKIRMIEFKDMTMYIFDPTIVDGKVSQEDYDALKQAIEEGKLIYTINSKRNGLDLATEVAIVGGTIYIESPDFIKEEGTDNISQVVFDTITVDGSLNYSKEQYTTTVIKTTGDGTKVLTDNGQYVYIGNLALTNIKFKDGTNTSTYDLVTNGITFRQNATPCVSWNTVKSGNNIYMDIRIANATASMDGLMSKEDYVELNTTIPGQIEDLKEADSNLNNRIDDLDDKIDKEIADREAEIDRIENKFDGVTDALEDALQKEIEDRKAGDTTITNSLNAFISTKGQPGGLAELDSTGKVPAAQLPSYVDDVLEFSTKAQFPQTGETGKIYVAKDTNLTYRWTGTQYLEISQSLALGETPSTAYPGDKGKANRDALNSMPTKLTSYLTPTTSTTGRTAKVYFDQDESGKRDYAELTQTGYTPPADNYVFTWDDGSTSDVSANFPWDFSANGTAANIPVVSTKNGSSQSWSVSSKPSWITTSTTSSKVTISASDNSGSARSGSVVLTQEDSGKTLTINVSQATKPAENVYVFTITPNTYNATYSNTTFIPRTTSTKNGSNIGYSLTSGDTDWVVVLTTGKISVEIMKNTTSSSRSTTLVFTQNESGKTQSIEITQSGQSAEYKFGFGSDLYSTDSVICDYQGGEFKNHYSIVSTKNGSNQSYYVSQKPIWVNGYSSGKVSIWENTSTASRNGDVILTQDESKKTITLKITQRGKPEEYLSIFNSDISTTAEYAVVNFKSSQPWTCGLTDYDADNPVIVGNTTGDASDIAQVLITYYKEYRRPRRVNYNIRQTAGQKLIASGSITFN